MQVWNGYRDGKRKRKREREMGSKAYKCAEATGSEGVNDRSRQSSRAAQKRGGCVSERGGGEQTRSARDSICSHGLVLRLYKYLM